MNDLNDHVLGETLLENDGDEPQVNLSKNEPFNSILEKRLSRRSVMAGAVGAAVAGTVGASLPMEAKAASKPRFLPPQVAAQGGPFALFPTLGFDSIPITRADTATLPEGYMAHVIAAWGTPLQSSGPAYEPIAANTGADQEQQVGSHHDGMHYFPSEEDPNGRGILCINHEYVDQRVLHSTDVPANTSLPGSVQLFDNGRRPADQVRKEIAAHGVSIMEIARDDSGVWSIQDSPLNRRITAQTRMELKGPVAGTDFVVTKYSPDGRHTRGTINNCAHGYTPWGTYLTCEENWAGYFRNGGERPREQSRYGVGSGATSRYAWETADNDADEYKRFDVTPVDGVDATQDYRNEANGFGWIVEIDPRDPNSTPKKRTAMGRMGHEGCWYAPPQLGQPIAFYMGDDRTFEYVYKFVTRARYRPGMRGDVLDQGTLYVARFNDDGTGEWLPLDYNNRAFRAAAAAAGVEFTSQADVLLNTRLAADVMGATPMDRPEWGTVHPQTREVYMTMTNNSGRSDTNAANPRAANRTGHIIRWREQGNRPWATRFDWDIFVLAGNENNSQILPLENGPALTESNKFASPDGLWFDQFGVLWIQTDMSGSQQAGTSPDGDFGTNAMLAANPFTGEIRRFLAGPNDQETTGVVSTPDGETLFVNFQHPGDRSGSSGFTSNWPDGQPVYRNPSDDLPQSVGTGARPRSATIVITKVRGGVVGLEDSVDVE